MALVETEEDIVAAAPSRSAQSQGLINKYLLHDAVTKAEIIWCLQAATRIHSNRTAADCVSLFPLMFSDSEIAKKMQLQKDKVGYLVVYGLAPFFRKQLLETYSVCDHITVGFDEALNDFSTKKQMDLVTRFWDPVTDLVSTRYLSSVFLQKATAKDLRLGIKEAIGPEIEKKMLQISMDGPSVNFSMLKDYQKELKEDHGGTTLVDIGSCGLHVVHGAFKTGVETTTWELKEFLISLHYLFYKSPARRGHFTKTTGSMEFPVPFCFTRWVENDKAGSRAIAMLPHLRTWVEEVQREGRANPLNKGHKNFDRVTRALNDRLLLPKLSFFVSTAKMVEPFLTKFQSDDPMAPLLFREIESLTIELLERVVKKNVLHAASRVIDVKLKDDNLVVAKDFDLGFATKAAIREANNSKPQKILDSVILQFRKECMAMYVRMVEKIQERSPLGYKMTRAISCLDPIVVCETQNLAEERVNVALDILCNSRNWISGAKADRIKSAYSALLRVPSVTARLKEFNGTSPRLDKLWTEVVAAAPSSVPNKDDLMYFIKMVLILYHSNAALERSFSLNNDCMVVNQKETSLIANRVVQDAVLAAGGVEKIAIPKALVLAARNSHSLYREAKEARSKEEKEAAAKVAEKRKATRQIEILAKKKKEILQSAQLEASDIESQINKLR
ncbi:hypothetical protein FOCC_FOCC003747 [Frankliniella occidentalis]|nr:hypothetical protein FOCC_FOCC003747 [Frankliniella occidentalis]